MSMMQSIRRFGRPFIVSVLGAAWCATATAAETLRVCADPDNLPFSKSAGKVHGIYVDLAEEVGLKLGMEVDYHWWYTFKQKRAMRNTLLANQCDAMFALPAKSEFPFRGTTRTVPFLNLRYAVISAPDLEFASLDDLKSMRLGVQFQTNPHILLAMRDGFETKTYQSAEALIQALSDSEIDAGFLWGPVAGYLNHKEFDGIWKVTPLGGTDWEGEVTVGVRSDRPDLVEKLNKALMDLQPEVANLAIKYHIPIGPAVNVDGPGATQRDIPQSTVVGGSASAIKAPTADEANAAFTSAVAEISKANSLEDLAKQGRVKFNDVCAHCHSQDGTSPVAVRDLRQLHKRYGDGWRQPATATMLEGRIQFGMPAWKGTFSEQQFAELLAFLETIQTKSQ